MQSSSFEKILDYWRSVYYTEPLVMICSILAMFVGLRYYRKEKPHIFLIIYSLSCFFLFIFFDIFRTIKFQSPRNKRALLEAANMIFGLIEFSVFYHLFLQIIKSKLIRMIMKFAFVLFLFLVMLFIVKAVDQNFNIYQIDKFSALIATIEFSLILIPIFSYFLEIFKSDPIREIIQSPSLWITSGLLLYSLATLPFLLVQAPVANSNEFLSYLMFSIHNVSLCFLFLTIIKAFICRKPITT